MSDERFKPEEQPAEFAPKQWPPKRSERQPPAVIPRGKLGELVDDFLEHFDERVPPGPLQAEPRRKPIKPLPEAGDDFDRGDQ